METDSGKVAEGQVAEEQVQGVLPSPSYCRGKLEYVTGGNFQKMLVHLLFLKATLLLPVRDALLLLLREASFLQRLWRLDHCRLL